MNPTQSHSRALLTAAFSSAALFAVVCAWAKGEEESAKQTLALTRETIEATRDRAALLNVINRRADFIEQNPDGSTTLHTVRIRIKTLPPPEKGQT